MVQRRDHCLAPQPVPILSHVRRPNNFCKRVSNPHLHPHYVTVNIAALAAVPPGVVITTLPVLAPAGTVNVTCLSEFTVKDVTLTPPSVMPVASMNPDPAIATELPTAPLAGVTLVIFGVTRYGLLLDNVPEGVVTVTVPVSPDGTFAVRYVSETTLKLALAPLNFTLVVPVNPFPRIPMDFPTTPMVEVSNTNGGMELSRL